MTSLRKISKLIMGTLCYSDIFDYPLTHEELWKYLIAENIQYPISNIKYQMELEKLIMQKRISRIGNYYCLKGREKIISLRKEREKISEEKLKRAKKLSKVLGYIPTIVGICLTGSIAMKNASTEDDVDFLIITNKHTLWITRIGILFVLELLGLRRRHTTENASGLICVNMLIDESTLLLPMKFRTLYGAHEVAQMVPLLDKKNVYTRVIRRNNWVQNFLPNAFQASTVNRQASSSLSFQERGRTQGRLPASETRQARNKVRSFLTVAGFPLTLIEPLARFLQMNYMKRRQTREITTATLAAFHPIDYAHIVRNKFKIRLKEYQISNDSFSL